MTGVDGAFQSSFLVHRRQLEAEEAAFVGSYKDEIWDEGMKVNAANR